MEGLVGGAIIGVAAALIGPVLLPHFSKIITPIGENFVQGSSVALGNVAGFVSSPGSGVRGLADSGGGSDKIPYRRMVVILKTLKVLAKRFRLI